MAFILPRPGYFVKQRFLKRFRKCRQALVRIRYLIIINNWNGRSAREIEKVLKTHNTTVYRVVRKFRERGEGALWDGREDNGGEKLCPDFLGVLDRLVRSSPQKHGWRRPTWTRETLVETLVRNPSALELEAREVTVLFSDMRGSTRFAEALPPEGLRLFHDEFFPAMADVVGSHGGLLVKTIGDAVMALWNAPLSTPDHAARAGGAALEMLATLEPLNRRWASRGWPEVAIRVGIHTGDALVGNFGSAARVEYDARGDTVNVASRLEGLCDAYAARRDRKSVV